MQKIKFDFEATKERIYAPNSNVPIGAPVDRNGNIANDGNAYGIVLCKETENEKYWVKYNLVVMVAGYCDIIDAQAIWGDEYSAEAMAAMSDIVFCDNHKIGGGGGDEPDLVLVVNQHFDDGGAFSKTDVSIATGTIADFVEKMENGNAKCVVKYHNVVEAGYAVIYGEITDVMVERYNTIVNFYYSYSMYGDTVCTVKIECGTDGTIRNVLKTQGGLTH